MTGRIKFFNQDKKFGFIVSDDRTKEFFFHVTAITGESVKCEKEEEVEFEPVESRKKPGTFEASNVRHPSGYKHKKFRLTGTPSSYLFQWSYIPLNEYQDKSGSINKGALHELAQLALDEDWIYGESISKKGQFPILHNYLVNTFYKLYHDENVYERTLRGESWAAFNTGLVNKLYDPIYALFNRNSHPAPPWKFHAFCCANIGRDGQTMVRHFNQLPPAPKYFTNAAEVIFDPDIEIIPRYDHIVYDSIERGRYPLEFLRSHLPPGLTWKEPAELSEHDRKQFFLNYRQALEQSPKADRDIRNRIDDAIALAVKRARWNFKTAIPLYYPRMNNISLLLPIALVNDDQVDLALVVRRTEVGGYSGETVYK